MSNYSVLISFPLVSVFRWPWRKFRIEIHSEPIRKFANHSGICIRIIQFHSDLIRRNFSIRINPRPIKNQSDLVIRMNPVNPNETESFGIIRIKSDWPDSFGLKVRIDRIIRIDRIHSDRKFGLILINSDRPDSIELIRITISDFFWMGLGLIRI